jgi:hypothetical protein
MSDSRITKKRAVLLGVVVCVVAVMVIASLGSIGGDQKSANRNTDLQSLVLTQSDLPSGWETEVPFSYGSQSPLPGEITGAGGCGFNLTAESGAGAYLTVGLFNYSSASEARHSLNLSLSIIANKSSSELQYWVVNTGDFAFKVKWNYSGQLVYPYSDMPPAISMFFQVGNVTCVMRLSYLAGFSNADSAFSEMVNTQEQKLSEAIR